MSLNGGYAMIKFNSTQEELAIAYKSKRPALFYDENQRAYWAVIEETATQSVNEETQEPITLYEYSYKLLDEASSVSANPTLSGDEATLDGLEVDGTKYKVGGSGGSGGKLYQHTIKIKASVDTSNDRIIFLVMLSYSNQPKNWQDILSYCENERQITGYARVNGVTTTVYWAKKYDNTRLNLYYYDDQGYFLPNGTVIDTVTEV